MITFDELCEMEPSLCRVDRAMKGIKDDGKEASFCANIIWYELVKPRIRALVGWKVEEKRGGIWNLADGTVEGQEDTPHALRSTEAYALVYHHLYEQLPACRNCMCM